MLFVSPEPPNYEKIGVLISTMLDDIIPRCLWLLFYVVAGGFFSAGETALSYCNTARIRVMADEGDIRAKHTEQLLDHFDETVVALLIGVNILHVVAAAAATVLFVGLMGNPGAGVATVVMTLVIFIFSETIPKNIANANSDAFILRTAGMILFFSRLFHPVVVILTKAGELCRKLLHFDDSEAAITEDEFATMVDNVQKEGLLEDNESDIIKSSIEFHDITARFVMTPRDKIVTVPLSASQEELKYILLENRFSRYPVRGKSMDDIVGVLVAGKCLFQMAHGDTVDIWKIMEPPLKLPVTVSAPDAFQEMQKHNLHFAILQSPKKETVGIITMDDILEELVDDIGEISEENAQPAKGGGGNG